MPVYRVHFVYFSWALSQLPAGKLHQNLNFFNWTAGETDSNPIILPKPVRDLSVSCRRMDDSIHPIRWNIIVWEKNSKWLACLPWFTGIQKTLRIFHGWSSCSTKYGTWSGSVFHLRFAESFTSTSAIYGMESSVLTTFRHPMPPWDEEAFEEIEFSGFY